MYKSSYKYTRFDHLTKNCSDDGSSADPGSSSAAETTSDGSRLWNSGHINAAAQGSNGSTDSADSGNLADRDAAASDTGSNQAAAAYIRGQLLQGVDHYVWRRRCCLSTANMN